ncbi:hypothetical protein L2D08_07615 [Domibacillus sp. PGB-M46]|uniref:hypothetical protein n=1 Tax=Domibacillus sp. PGB-M46 TaxID=2910255 RepID=UPI001F587BFD|nr:hypothetical protein [Domibacillus sp. PGB-M46]MCI2254228.1 hypothetical protein [Domibacillus sp. PGB-M46]
MNKKYLSIILIVLLIFSLVSSFALYDLWQQEKDKAIQLKQELNGANKQIEALNSNHEQEINKAASNFVERLFTYDPRVYENGRQAALKMTIGGAKEKITKEQSRDPYEEFREQGETTISLVNITDSVYNKTGNETAEVIVQFEQELVLKGIRTKTINEMKLWMHYTGGEWKIKNYEMMQVA